MSFRPPEFRTTRVEALTTEANRVLARRRAAAIAAGDADGAREARAAMILGNQRLVVSQALKFLHRGLDLDDLIQEGTIGLMRAVERYDPDREAFATYSRWWIRLSIRRAIHRYRFLIHIPFSIQERRRDANPEYVADAAHARRVASLDSGAVSSDHRDELARFDDGPVHALGSDDRERALRAVALLPPTMGRAIRARFGLGSERARTMREFGEEIGCSRQRAQSLYDQGLRLLKRECGRDVETGQACEDDAAWRVDEPIHTRI